MSNDDEQQPSKDWPIACALTEENRRSRRDTIIEPLFRRRQAVRSLTVGYAVQFPGHYNTAAQVLEFIAGEHACCPFLTVELIFEPGNGPIRKHIRRRQGVWRRLTQGIRTFS